MKDPKVVILLFASGSLVITGTKTRVQVGIADDKIRGVLVENGFIFH